MALPSDQLSGKLIKATSRVTLGALVHIVSLSISESSFCPCLKYQLVVPHHKKGDKTLPENYRPVCYLVEVGKLVELVVWDQLMEHCLAHGLIQPNYHGSILGHDCVTAVVQLQDTVTLAADSKLLSAVVMLDQKVAFDLVDHRVLLLKMEAYNFSKETIP